MLVIVLTLYVLYPNFSTTDPTIILLRRDMSYIHISKSRFDREHRRPGVEQITRRNMSFLVWIGDTTVISV